MISLSNRKPNIYYETNLYNPFQISQLTTLRNTFKMLSSINMLQYLLNFTSYS